MRPPVQKSALQQNEANRLQHHQQTHKHLQQQKQLQQQPDIIATTISDLEQKKLEQRALLVENHLNSACFAQVHTHHQQQQQQQQLPEPPPFASVAPRTIARKSLPEHYDDCYQQRRPTDHLEQPALKNNSRDSTSGVQLLDLSTAPPAARETLFQARTTSAEVPPSRTPSTHNTNTNNSQKRFSFASQYSSRSSSSDESSSSFSLTTGCGDLPPAPQHAAIVSASNNHNSCNNTFDDAAEHFVINFPADTFPLSAVQPHSDCYLPLSETEPLLTNIEATVNDKQRSIYLNKNSASLIFTRKDLSAAAPHWAKPATVAATSYQQHQKRQHFKLESKTNNNFDGTTSSVPKTLAGTASATATSCGGTTILKPQNHSTLRSFSEENYKRKPTKHLPATYHQQHRRSLQLNYNNNLVTTTTCGAIANNNHCCSGTGTSTGTSTSTDTSACLSHSKSAVLHKTHHNNLSNQQQQQQQKQKPKQTQLLKQGQPYSSSNSNTCTATNNTAAAARKQYAYSWYAPVYSALEEELEQDSRDSSPLHNLANTKKQHIHPNRHSNTSNSLLAPTADNDTETETEALLEHRRNINIQGRGGGSSLKRDSVTKQPYQTRNSSGRRNHQSHRGIAYSDAGDSAPAEEFSNYELEGPHAASLGLAGGPQPRRIRFGNFLKSLVGLRPSPQNRPTGNADASAANARANGSRYGESTPPVVIPSSPEITITRTPSDQNLFVLRDPSGYCESNSFGSREKLASFRRERTSSSVSTSSLNVMQQKLWNIVRRHSSAISLHHEKSQSIVHYTGLRKCETVLALTNQATSPCSPAMRARCASFSRNRFSEGHANRLSSTGSGVFSANGVEQIRPLNRLRNSVSSMNNTCSRCSSLLSLAASGSRYSLSTSANPIAAHASHQYLRTSSNISSSNISNTYSRRRGGSVGAEFYASAKRNSRTSGLGSQQNFTGGATSTASSRTPSITSPTATTATTASTIKLTTPPTENCLTVPPFSPLSSFNFSLASSVPAAAPVSAPVSVPVPVPALRESLSFPTESLASTSLPVTSLLRVNEHHHNYAHEYEDDDDNDNDNAIKNVDHDMIDGGRYRNKSSSFSGNTFNKPCSPCSSSSATSTLVPLTQAIVNMSTRPASTPAELAATLQPYNATNEPLIAPARPFEPFTCKLCLIDADDISNSTTLHQCGCQFCTECMKAYVEFEISEGAYEISCPDAQCPEQGVMTLPEIAALTTNNLMKRHHRYRLNREIELDKTRTWCPRAGCETVCLIGPTSFQSDSAPSTSASSATSTAPSAINPATTTPNGTNTNTSLCVVQCPSCKDEFCSACKKTWHPNITCEEHSRRLAADGQDDIGIPFDNDLIKCCPMCAVPIEKDEGCAQMMCKRCKHVFCWYCLASLDDDFLLRHYDKGPCKNKLGHSRASVVWHRAQVIGIFAGFGILLLVASPLLLLAAPCIICCKCRSCSGSKIDEGDGEIEEATALQSLN